MTQISSTFLTRREALAALGAVALAACFSDRTTDPPDEGDVEIEMRDLSFSPATVTIEAGERVVWRNTGQFVHTSTCDPADASDPDHVQLPTGAATWDSGAVAVGGTFSHTFEVAGEYHYFCIPHQDQGMLGTIIVT